MNDPRARQLPGSSIAQLPQPEKLQQTLLTLSRKRPLLEISTNTMAVPTQIGSEPLPKRKRICISHNNVNEVQGVRTLPPAHTNIVDENEDEETKEYRKKIQEQKQLRERILQQKEARRKLTALKNHPELQQDNLDLQTADLEHSPRGNQGKTETAEVMRKKLLPDKKNFNELQPLETLPSVHTKIVHENEDEKTKQYCKLIEQQKIFREIILQQKETRRKLAALKNQREQQQNNLDPQAEGCEVLQTQTQGQDTERGDDVARGQMIMLQEQPYQQEMTAVEEANYFNHGDFETVEVMRDKWMAVVWPSVESAPSQRIVRAIAPLAPEREVQTYDEPALRVQPQEQQETRPGSATSTVTVGVSGTAQPQGPVVGPSTKVVGVRNLAPGTTEAQLRRMCCKFGAVEEIEMIPAQRKAIISFANPSSAAMFLRTYQRKLVDLHRLGEKSVEA